MNRDIHSCFEDFWFVRSHAECSVLCHNIGQVRSALEQPAVRSCKAVPLGIGTSGITLERIEDHNKMCKLMYLVCWRLGGKYLCSIFFMALICCLLSCCLLSLTIRKTQLKSHCLPTCKPECYFVVCTEFI